MKIRNGFVSNSSSSSFVVFSHDAALIENVPPPDGMVFGWDGETEFDWGPEEVHGPHSMINFAYLQSQYGAENHPEWEDMLVTVLAEYFGVAKKDISFVLTTSYMDEDREDARWGYIDHQSNAREGENTEIFESLDALRSFIFGVTSCIVLDNDNH